VHYASGAAKTIFDAVRGDKSEYLTLIDEMDEEEDDNCNDSYFHADEDIDENVSDIC
jgi:hypothetical protein